MVWSAGLPGDPLHQHAKSVLLTTSLAKSSWFVHVRNILLSYELPHPLHLLNSPPTKEVFKKMVKAKVIDHWEQKLRMEAALLPSLKFFQPNFLSLSTPHRIWTTAGQKPYEVAKARIQLLFLSGQYPCGSLTRHWSHENPQGFCTFPACHGSSQIETTEHILLLCQILTKL